MFLEFISELANDFSPVYAYVLSILMSVYFSYRAADIQFGTIKKSNENYMRKTHASMIRSLPVLLTIGVTVDKRNWRSHKMMYRDADDDTEAPTFSFYNQKDKRGGEQWKNNRYSHLLKNTALSGSYF
ncbi:hypothetical protein [Oceanobacillus manasiensis]|uniref:hypothetical protein n=1 Tax=Oceanobacillus manasiensis TaxID=586413 RepID=UPI0005A904C0|nr:hypothetical protein [Oceanobacillus manasiensis]